MLGTETWAAAALDTVGSVPLANVCITVKYRGAVAACGLAQGLDLPTSMLPYLLPQRHPLRHRFGHGAVRGMSRGLAKLALDLDADRLDAMTQVRPLERVLGTALEILAGRVRCQWAR
jgi:acrylyl-CoA reductase (NADPH)